MKMTGFSQHTQTDGGLATDAMQCLPLLQGARWTPGLEDQPSCGEKSGTHYNAKCAIPLLERHQENTKTFIVSLPVIV